MSLNEIKLIWSSSEVQLKKRGDRNETLDFDVRYTNSII